MARVECVAFLPLFLIFPHLLPCRAQNASTPSTAVPLPSATPVSVSSAYACQKCVTKSVRAMYLYHADFTECVGARGKGEGCGNGATATPECFNWKNWKSGWIGAAAHRILTELGPPSVIAMTPANFSVESRLFYQGSSDYTRCLYEIRLGKVDLCVGRFWETPEYRRLVPFTSQLFVDNLRLITTPMDFTPSTGYAVIDAVNKFNYATLYRHIIQPFSNEVWYITSGMLIFGGIVIWLVESVAPDSRFARESVLSGICKSVWVSWMSFVCATSAVEVTRWPGRLIMVGYAFFIYVVVVLYVANLSAILSLKSTQKASISSIQDINREGSFLCLIEDMANLIAYTLPQQQMLIFDEYGPALEKLYRGGCAGSLIGFFEYHKYIRAQDVSFSVCLDPLDERGWSKCKNPTSKSAFIDLNCKCKSDPKLDPKDCIFDCPFANKRYCPLLEVTDDEDHFSLSYALPTAPFLQNHLSAWVIRLRANGEMDEYIKNFALNKYCDVCGQSFTADSCEEKNAKGEGKVVVKTPVDELDLEYMAGIYVWIAGGLISTMSRTYSRLGCTPPTVEMGELEFDRHDRDKDVTELVKDQGTTDFEALAFERNLDRDLDGLKRLMVDLTDRVQQLENLSSNLM